MRHTNKILIKAVSIVLFVFSGYLLAFLVIESRSKISSNNYLVIELSDTGYKSDDYGGRLVSSSSFHKRKKSIESIEYIEDGTRVIRILLPENFDISNALMLATDLAKSMDLEENIITVSVTKRTILGSDVSNF